MPAQRLGIVCVTSAIPSHPSTELISLTLGTYAARMVGFSTTRLVVVCDGCLVGETPLRRPVNKLGKVDPGHAERYGEFRSRLRRGLVGPCLPHERLPGPADRSLVTVVEQPLWRGYAGCLADGLRVLRGEGIRHALVVQHDWVLGSPLDPRALLEDMAAHAMDYVVFTPRSLESVPEQIATGEFGDPGPDLGVIDAGPFTDEMVDLAERGAPWDPGHADASSAAPMPKRALALPDRARPPEGTIFSTTRRLYVPFPHWHDKPHVADCDVYLSLLDHYKVGRFPEDELGAVVRRSVAASGLHPVMQGLPGGASRSVRIFNAQYIRSHHANGRTYISDADKARLVREAAPLSRSSREPTGAGSGTDSDTGSDLGGFQLF